MQVCRRLSAKRQRGWLGAVATAALLFVLIPPAPPAQADTFDDACATPTIVDVGGSTTYSLSSSDILFIDTGTYTGTINNFPSGSTICVDTGGCVPARRAQRFCRRVAVLAGHRQSLRRWVCRRVTTVDPTTSTTSVEGDLPLTGAELTMLGVLGMSAIGLGGAMVVSARGRRRTGRHRL